MLKTKSKRPGFFNGNFQTVSRLVVAHIVLILAFKLFAPYFDGWGFAIYVGQGDIIC